MNMTPNLNGTDRSVLIEQRIAIGEAIRTLREVMRAGWPNARDYQLAQNPAAAFRADCDDWEAFERTAAAFSDKLVAEAEVL